jgi:hypothetical protein
VARTIFVVDCFLPLNIRSKPIFVNSHFDVLARSVPPAKIRERARWKIELGFNSLFPWLIYL